MGRMAVMETHMAFTRTWKETTTQTASTSTVPSCLLSQMPRGAVRLPFPPPRDEQDEGSLSQRDTASSLPRCLPGVLPSSGVWWGRQRGVAGETCLERQRQVSSTPPTTASHCPTEETQPTFTDQIPQCVRVCVCAKAMARWGGEAHARGGMS